MFLRVGHRGAKAYMTENTIAGFLKALELGANAVEFDVRRAKDGALVVIHDDNLRRVFASDLTVSESTLTDLKNASMNLVPTVAEALDALAGRVAKILVELKEPGCEEAVLDLVRAMNLMDATILASFHEEVLNRIRTLDGSAETGLIYARHRDPIGSASRVGAGYLLPLYRQVHREDILGAHARGLKVVVWTINSRREAAAFAARGVDGIASDKPDILRGLQTAAGPGESLL